MMYNENEVTAFIVLDIVSYNRILRAVADNVSMSKYQKCLYYNRDDDSIGRVVATSVEPICPVAFDSKVGPYKYEYSIKKSLTKSKRSCSPVWFDDFMAFIAVSVKSSLETIFDNFESVVKPADELSGTNRKELIVDRFVIYEESGTRLSLNKKCKFSGNGQFRQPDVPVYILEYEVEHDRTDYDINSVCQMFLKECRIRLKLSSSDVYDIIRSGQNNCLPESDIFIHVLSMYTRNFVPGRVTSADQMYICKKWDGCRAMGFWREDKLILYGQFGFKSFTNMPRLFAPDCIVQVEYFETDDTFVVTEIFAVVNVEMDTDFVYCMRRHGNSFRPGEGLYNGSNTSVQLQDDRLFLICEVNIIDSISAIETLHKYYPKLFTTHFKLSNTATIDWNKLLTAKEFTGRSDGIILKVFNDGVKYYKIKKHQTVELLYRRSSQKFISMDGTPYNDKIDEIDKHIINKCNNSNVDTNMEFYVVNKRLKFKCIRYDKIEPDSDKKINTIVNEFCTNYSRM